MSAVNMRDKNATCVVLEMILKHTADVFETLVQIVGEKYDIPRDEMFEFIQAHPKWKGMVVDPALHALTAEPVVVPEPAVVPLPPSTKPKRQWSEAAKAAAAAKRAARKAEESTSAPPTEPIVPGPPPTTETKVVRKFVIKSKSKPASISNEPLIDQS